LEHSGTSREIKVTFETRTTIEIRDIVAVEFECPRCHAKMNIPLNAENIVPLKCNRGCEPQWYHDNGLEYKDLQKLFELLKQYSKHENKPCAIRLELAKNKEVKTEKAQ
jgi:uncharacterized C2H2 Zn-finger protein